ncbi:MAG: hypothetical protein FP833_07040 [Atribacteria sp.]|nr:hypothetical protein [Candidatus Atribacteria bacterium]
MKHGEKSVVVEFAGEKGIKKSVFFLDNEEDKKQLNKIILNKEVQTIHSQEATLEQTFIKLTGRGLI